MAGGVYAHLTPEIVRATYGDRADARELARGVSYAQRHAIRHAYELWKAFDEPRYTSDGRRVGGPKRPPMTWGTEWDGTRWPLDDPRYMPTHKVGSHATFPVPKCGYVGKPMGKVYSFVQGKTVCGRRAGERTQHYGAGPCWRHRGNTTAGKLRGAWILAHAFAREFDIAPWDALLKAVRIAAGKAAYAEWVLSHAEHDLEIEGRLARSDDGLLMNPDTGEPLGVGSMRDLSFWRDQSELWTDRMARYGKMAIDAGVAERLVQQVELEAQSIARVLNGVFEALGDSLSDEQIARARGVARKELLSLEAEGAKIRTAEREPAVVDGTWQERM